MIKILPHRCYVSLYLGDIYLQRAQTIFSERRDFSVGWVGGNGWGHGVVWFPEHSIVFKGKSVKIYSTSLWTRITCYDNFRG